MLWHIKYLLSLSVALGELDWRSGESGRLTGHFHVVIILECFTMPIWYMNFYLIKKHIFIKRRKKENVTYK